MNENILTVENLTVLKNDHDILNHVSFEVKTGETVAVIGPNGAGKTTLFKALLNLIPYTGTVTWKKNIKLGYVPQKLYVESDLPLTTFEFFQLKEKNKEKILLALKSVGLTKNSEGRDIENHILKNRLGVLSGGELQRVLIAWALLGNPDVLLFDEPTSGVDIVGEDTIYSMLERLKTTKHMTILIISHEIDIVFKHASKVVCLNKEKICYGPPHKALTNESIEKLFGEKVDFFHHNHKT